MQFSLLTEPMYALCQMRYERLTIETAKHAYASVDW